MEVALRQRLDGVADISISQSKQTAEVQFVPGAGAFVPAAFRDAAKQADVEVLSLEIDACGVVEQREGTRVLNAGPNTFIVAGPDDVPVGQRLCVSGPLDDSTDPARLTIATF